MSKFFRSPKYLTLLGAVVLSLLLIVTYVNVRAQPNADREIEIQLEKAGAPTDLSNLSLSDYIAVRNDALREKAATSPELKTTAMIFFSDNKAPDNLRTFLAESQIPLSAIKGVYHGWRESTGGFDVTEKRLQDLGIQNTDDLVVAWVKTSRYSMSTLIQHIELSLVGFEKVEFKEPGAKEMTLRATREALQKYQEYEQHDTQFYSLRVEYELGRLIEIQNRPDVELVDTYDEAFVGRISPFAIKDAKEGR